MSSSKQKETCAICLNDMEENKKAHIDCCSHLFCYDCIKTWAGKFENKCPLCKQKLNEITYKDDK